MSVTSKIAIVILAAGASKRMGRPKQLLKWGEASLLNHTINTATKTSATEIIILVGANKDEVIANIQNESITIIHNENWELGLGKSIACAAKYVLNANLEVKGLLFMLADQPYVSSLFLERMINCYKSESNKIVATAYNSEKMGVPALFDQSFYHKLTELVGDSGAKSILKANKNAVRTLTPDFKNLDIDTPEDYNRLKLNKDID